MKHLGKNISMFLVLSAMLVLVANCGKKEETQENTANPTMASTCYLARSSNAINAQSTSCNYNYSAIKGFSPVQSNGYQYVAGGTSSMSCGIGTQLMVYSPSKGIGCVDNKSLYLNGQFAVYDLHRTELVFKIVSTAGQNYGLMTTYGQFNYTQAFQTYFPTQATGGAGVYTLRLCDATEACPSGLTCRSPFGPQTASAAGVCYH